MSNFIHWKELNGNKFLTKLHPDMLQGDGYAVKRTQALSRRTKQMVERHVIFDKSYVIEVLKNHIDLLGIDQDEAIDLIGDVFEVLEQERSAEEITEYEALRGER